MSGSPGAVAPRVGAWIETMADIKKYIAPKSRPAWARGLKLALSFSSNKPHTSRPAWARGLKPLLNVHNCRTMRVAPRVGAWIETMTMEEWVEFATVAPRVGAWIETQSAPAPAPCGRRRAPRGRVD